MISELNFTSSAVCVACLSSGRNINLVNDDESKQMFGGLIDNLECSSYPIPLCFECMGRLHNTVYFKRQVNKAHKYLISFMKENESLTSLSTLSTTKIDLFCIPAQSYFGNTDKETPTCEFDGILQTDTLLKENTKQKVSIRKKYSHNDIDSDNESDNIFETNPSQDETLQSDFKATGVIQNGEVDSGLKSFLWDVKNEDEKLNVKKEPEDCQEKKIEEVELQERKEDFNDSDDEPLNNIKAIKQRLKKIKKEKKGRKATRERSAGVVQAAWVTNKLRALHLRPGDIDVVVLSWDEVECERQKALASPRYTRHEFRCADCVVGFNHRFKLDAHMRKHSPEAGDLECEICKTRFKTNSALLCHRRRHRTRWRCGVCAALYSRAGVAADHAARAHAAAAPRHRCHLCPHTDTSLSKLRAHLRSHAEKQHCDQCGKVFPDKSSLRTHLFIHTDQKDFSCSECDKRFRFKKALEIHRVTHQPSELLYCRECDMNFKNRISFYQHINYSMKHIHPDKIKYACEFCSRRFSKPARLEEHRLSIHLKLAPHRCTVDGCTFASASRPALRTHTRMVHRHKRLERNHVCHACGKAYTTKKILEGHIRSHTGERPFACAACAATFSHDAALYNHNKLVHKVPFVRRQRRPAAPATDDTQLTYT